ncbi:MAG: chromosome segregation protein SMC [Gammaproteobacteria bacterium]|nr:chromosome segregation protein SMC [Gammaproteobacteria bacterium]
MHYYTPLKSIKLSGFKSFVDPTVISLTSNLTAVVGPNGCGKSNVVDAIRWVIGESSAKNLRAESMADVIFNGTTNRKPVGQASIELTFDNTDGRLSSEYANYNEISVRRILQRDGQSQYFLNNTRCRRKDILDIFLGTGLGPRSYSIIEQGMISRIIEAKPEDLRIFLEETAGISKYKERRRETETRIRHTRENLDRLKDLRDELEKQLDKLKRQSSAAERYKVLNQELRVMSAQAHLMQLRDLHGTMSDLSQRVQVNETLIESKIAEQLNIDKNIELIRIQHTEKNDQCNEIQSQYYQLGTEIAKLEHTISHSLEREQQLRNDLTQIESNLRRLDEQQIADQDQLRDAQQDLLQIEENSRQHAQEAAESATLLEEAQNQLQASQQAWDAFQSTIGDTKRHLEVTRTQLQHHEHRAESLENRRARLLQLLEELSTNDISENVELHQQQLAELQSELSILQQLLDESKTKISEYRESQRNAQESLQDSQGQLQRLQGRQSSLHALQEVAMGRKNSQHQAWLAEQGLAENTRLAEVLTVDAGWEKAVETVLDQHLESICVDNYSQIIDHIDQLGAAKISFLNSSVNAEHATQNSATPLSDKVQTHLPISKLLSGVYCVDNIHAALELLPRLNASESIVTLDGIWLSHLWLRIHHAVDEHTGVLARQQELADIATQIEHAQEQVDSKQELLQSLTELLHNAEHELEFQQQHHREKSTQLGDTRSQLSAQHSKLEQLQERQKDIQKEINEINENAAHIQSDIQTCKHTLEQAEQQLAIHAQDERDLQAQRTNAQEHYRQLQHNANLSKQKADEMQIRCASTQNQIHYLEQGIARASQQVQQLTERRETALDSISSLLEPLPEMRDQLSTLLEQRLDVEKALTAAKQQLSEFDQQLRDAEKRRAHIEEDCQEIRHQHEQLRLQEQTAKVKAEAHQEHIAKSGLTNEEILQDLPEDAEVSVWHEKIEANELRIQRLGPINLAAIEEFQQSAERKEYLDQQNADLTEALETLESAIRKIDRETRAKFKETFDQVNQTFEAYFPKIFGGGQACLELTGDELLDAGVTVKAQPPGKRNTSIHVLSGGEKALTAIALVFSLFQLNPAPFCILDEVDAPLDDANVGRYCNLVKEMSEKVQFLFISHNKIAIEMAKQLCGVTMHEPGVSRMVAVDIDEAIAMAEA